MRSGPPLITDKKTAFDKGARYCAYQERSQQELRSKLYDIGVAASIVEEVISDLVEQNFINEERFARAYAGGKFRLKGWGRLKIRKGLQFKGVSDFCIRAGMQEIDEEAYVQKLRSILEDKLEAITGKDPFVKNRKAAAYAISRGYEPQLVWDIIKLSDDATA